MRMNVYPKDMQVLVKQGNISKLRETPQGIKY